MKVVADFSMAGKSTFRSNTGVKLENKNSFSSEKDVLEKRMKNTLSYCVVTALAVDIIYFAMKRNFKYNRMKKIATEAEKRANTVLSNISKNENTKTKVKLSVKSVISFVKQKLTK